MHQRLDDHPLLISILKVRKMRHEGVKFLEHTGIFVCSSFFLHLFLKFTSVDLCVSLNLYRNEKIFVLGWHLDRCVCRLPFPNLFESIHSLPKPIRMLVIYR